MMSARDLVCEALRRAVADPVRALVDEVVDEVVAEVVAQAVAEKVRDRFRAEKPPPPPKPAANTPPPPTPTPTPTARRPQILTLREILAQLPGSPPEVYDIEDEAQVRARFGPAATRLTPELAARLTGKTAHVLAGQNWWDDGDRLGALTLMTFHGEAGCCGGVLVDDGGESYSLSEHRGYLGSGSGCDPVFVFVW